MFTWHSFSTSILSNDYYLDYFCLHHNPVQDKAVTEDDEGKVTNAGNISLKVSVGHHQADWVCIKPSHIKFSVNLNVKSFSLLFLLIIFVL